MKIRNKIVGGILAVAVIGTCAYAACGTNSTPTNEQLVLQPFIPEKDNQNSSVESESQACIGMSLTVSEILYEDYVEYNVSSEAIKAYTLTARYAPSYVTMSAQVDWSVSFVNPASEWAVGKTATDYITVTPETDGALTATVEGWEGFSSDILITATLRANNAVKANCLCVWIHNNDEGGENEGGGNSGSSGDDGTGDSSSGSGSSGTQNPDSGNTDSGNTDSGNTGAIGSTDNRNDELFEGNYA
ncbi:MAG: hypothetical protein IJW60_03150, partial [Clostridia bacterium]|nr:hypothetical protein [Clostridia bacterium]